MVLRRYCVFRRGGGVFLGWLPSWREAVASILSIDPKQLFMAVANRSSDDDDDQRKVARTEPSLDTLVTKAAAIAAASIAFRDHIVQMLRDGHYRLCEAHINGGFSEFHAGDGSYPLLEEASGLRSVA